MKLVGLAIFNYFSPVYITICVNQVETFNNSRVKRKFYRINFGGENFRLIKMKIKVEQSLERSTLTRIWRGDDKFLDVAEWNSIEYQLADWIFFDAGPSSEQSISASI